MRSRVVGVGVVEMQVRQHHVVVVDGAAAARGRRRREVFPGAGCGRDGGAGAARRGGRVGLGGEGVGLKDHQDDLDRRSWKGKGFSSSSYRFSIRTLHAYPLFSMQLYVLSLSSDFRAA